MSVVSWISSILGRFRLEAFEISGEFRISSLKSKLGSSKEIRSERFPEY